MIFNISDIKLHCPQAYKLLPDILKVNTNNYFVIIYKNVYETGSVIVSEVKSMPTISLSIESSVKHPNTFSYFKQPFDSRNFILYQILLSLASEHKSEIVNMYAQFREQDRAQSKMSESSVYKYDEIFNANNFRSAISKYIIGGKKEKIINEVCFVADAIDSYFERKSESLYQVKLSKVIGALQDNDGNLIPDNMMGKIRFMLVGRLSDITGQEPTYTEAIRQMRSGVQIPKIYDNTGWFYVSTDKSWRKQIDDSKSKICENGVIMDSSSNDNKYYLTKNGIEVLSESLFQEVYLKNDYTSVMDKLPNLSDVLIHPTLYKEYPFLAYMKCLYGVQSAHSHEYMHFCSDKDNLIVSFCNPNDFHKHTVLLHEVQHAIQHKENWGLGGNTFLSSIGMESTESLRIFVSSMNIVKNVFQNISEITLQPIAEFFKMGVNPDKSTLAVKYFQYCIQKKEQPFSEAFTNQEFEKIFDAIKKAREIMMLGQAYALRLKSQGYSQKEVDLMVFKAYEMLFGEMEARYTQKSALSEDFKDYFYPFSAETYKEGDLILYTDNYQIIKAEKKNFLSAIETLDGKYTLHLRTIMTCEPIIHELGHILYDEFASYPDLFLPYAAEMAKTHADEMMAKGLDSESVDEEFVSFFLSYLKRNCSELSILGAEIKNEQTNQWVDSFLNHVLFDKTIGVYDLDVAKAHTEFVKKLIEML